MNIFDVIYPKPEEEYNSLSTGAIIAISLVVTIFLAGLVVGIIVLKKNKKKDE